MGWIPNLIRAKAPAKLDCEVEFREAGKKELKVLETNPPNFILDRVVNTVALANFYDFRKLYDLVLRTSPEVAACPFPGYVTYLTRNPKVIQTWLSLHRNDSLFTLSESDSAVFKLIQQCYPAIQKDDIVFTCSPKMTAAYHKFLENFFSIQSMKNRIDSIEEKIEQVLQEWNGEEISLNPKVASLASAVMSEVILGETGPCDKLAEAVSNLSLWLGDITNASTNRVYKEMANILPTLFLLSPEAKLETKNILQEAINTALSEKEFPKNTPLPLIKAMLEKDEFSKEQAIATALSLLIAGQNNSVTSLTYAILKLAQNPELQRKICQKNEDPLQSELIRGILSESLRVMCPVNSISRLVNKASVLTLKGEKSLLVRAGEKVNSVLAQVARDSNLYPNPDQFDYHRFKGDLAEFPKQIHMPFGYGPHTCPGWYLYYVISAITIDHLARNYTISTSFVGEPKQKSLYHTSLAEVIPIKLERL